MPGVSSQQLTATDGARAVELAREAVEAYVQNGTREQPGSMRDAFYDRTGAFVRLTATRGRGSLRGCAGVRESSDHLGRTLVEMAIEAASDDSCGSEIRPPELTNLIVSICIVDDVQEPDDPRDALEIGRHGVTVERDGKEGWLYPTVPVQNDWSPAEYLDRTCRKTGLAPTAWEQDDTTVTLFEGRIFREREPNGSVQELKI
jgi:hypothetical protein